MTAVAVKANETSDNEAPVQSTRETVESVVVAFILAFLFRAFVAEAFVIPTGSMAPTLMGAHKDIFCEFCGQQYQASASDEFNSNTGAITDEKTIASKCSTCRGLNAYDFRHNPDHASFSGDRILVSKFDYVLSSPKRWDVFVFKYPLRAQMNYIKRLIGLPGETLRLSEGDVYIKGSEADAWTIARKPPDKIRAMRQIVADTDHQANILVRQGWPSLWQPWTEPGNESQWTISQSEGSWSAELKPNSGPDWLRYYHKVVNDETWQEVTNGKALPKVDPRSSELVTDFLAYNSPLKVAPATDAFKLETSFRFIPFLQRTYWAPVDEINGEVRALDYARSNGLFLQRGHGDGHHWVGDLASEFSVDVQSDSGRLLADVVEFGVHFQVAIDVATGQVSLEALDNGLPLDIFNGASRLNGQSTLRGKGRHQVEIANFDDQIVLWVNGRLVEFDAPSQFRSQDFRNGAERRPYWSEADPLDAAPLGIGGVDIAMRVERARVFRDIYYIAVQGNFSDYDLNNYQAMVRAIPDRSVFAGSSEDVLDEVYSHPQWWSKTNLFQQRGSKEFQLEERQYFPMGDNSASSSDARVWYGHQYVEEKYLLGKALLVFWPHTWNRPVPFAPNFRRMGRIR